MPTSLKHFAQLFLGRIGLYQRVKSSFLYDLYWSVAGKQLINFKVDTHRSLPKLPSSGEFLRLLHLP